VVGSLGVGYLGGGINSSLGNFSVRQDWDLRVSWTLQNFGLGNRALVKQRAAENKVALVELFRVQDRVAAEVVQAYALAQTAQRRVGEAETGLKEAQELVRQALTALGQTQRRGDGGPVLLLARPLEVVSGIQMLQQAYVDYYSSIADSMANVPDDSPGARMYVGVPAFTRTSRCVTLSAGDVYSISVILPAGSTNSHRPATCTGWGQHSIRC